MITITNVFQKLLDEPDCKPNIVWVDKATESYNRPMEPWLQDNVIETCSTQNEGNFAVAEKFIRTLKEKIYKYIAVKSKRCVLINLII